MAQSKKWKESRRAFRRSLKNGWQIYKRSKIGLVGLGIIIMFVVMAVFAPFITPYTPYYTAPSVDIIRDDTYSITLQNSSSWIYAPVGIMNYVTAPGANINLTSVLIYNDIGQAQIFPVGYNYTSQKILKIYLKSPTNYSIPKGITSLYETGTYMASFMNANTFIANSSRNFYILDSNLKVYRNFSLPFTIQEKSIFYNNPFIMPSVGQYSLISFSHGNETILYIFYNRQLNYFGMPQPIHKIPLAKLYINTSERVINSPLIYLNPNDVSNGYLNTSQIIIPTNNSLVSYGFNIKMDPGYEALGFNVPQVVSEPYVKWIVNYTDDHGQSYLPLSITYGYDWGDSPGIQSTVVVGTNTNEIIGYSRADGKMLYDKYFVVSNSALKDYKLKALYPTNGGIIFAYATLGDRSIVALINPGKGTVQSNGTFYNVLEGALNSIPTYDVGSSRYITSTTAGDVYLLQPNMVINQTFSIIGGMKTPINGLGNVLSYTAQMGYYYGTITNSGQLYMQETIGTNIAPLPPGKYPSGNTYILGTDAYGRDIWTWLVYGSRAELVVGIVAALSSVLLGTFLGLISGFYGGWVDSLIMRITDIFLSLPGLVIMLILAASLGPNIWNIIFVIAILSWSGITRIIRAQVLSLKTRAFIDAARISGASKYRLMMVHIFPNVLPLTFLYMSFGVSGAIITEASLAFLGMGDPHAVTWGMMLQYLWTTGHVLDAPWWLLPPGIAITLLSLAFYLVGRAFDEVINPRLRRR
ncbi:MAG: ABC transporter permease [Thermoplasmata archaeon]